MLARTLRLSAPAAANCSVTAVGAGAAPWCSTRKPPSPWMGDFCRRRPVLHDARALIDAASPARVGRSNHVAGVDAVELQDAAVKMQL